MRERSAILPVAVGLECAMPAPRILFVKLSSLGDIVHTLPAVTDLAERRPGAHVAWVVEEAYVDLVKLHPAVAEAIPFNLRSLRRNPLRPSGWRRIAGARRGVGEGGWDYVVDAQGLIKSAIVTKFARAPAFGLDAKSARERLAARFYDVKIPVSWSLHAVDRNRKLLGEIFGYSPQGEARYGLTRAAERPAWAPQGRYIVMLHAASRAEKRWPQERWIALGQLLARHDYAMVLPGGTTAERAVSARIAAELPNAMAAPEMSLGEVAALLGHASGVVGVDTGLTHLAVALGVPTVGIYCATQPDLTGLHGGGHAVNVGGRGAAPSVEAVGAAIGLGSQEE
jgi:lipopolysaccharide heptosyltransferase I